MQRAPSVKAGSKLRHKPLPLLLRGKIYKLFLMKALNGMCPGISKFSSQNRPLDSIVSELAAREEYL